MDMLRTYFERSDRDTSVYFRDKKCDTEMKNAGIQTIYKYGVAFSGKNVEVAVE